MDGALFAAIGSAIISAISLFYSIGKDRSPQPAITSIDSDSAVAESRLDAIAESVNRMNDKLDKIVEWQLEATSSHVAHDQKIASLTQRVDRLESQLDLQENAVLPMLNHILERIN